MYQRKPAFIIVTMPSWLERALFVAGRTHLETGTVCCRTLLSILVPSRSLPFVQVLKPTSSLFPFPLRLNSSHETHAKDTPVVYLCLHL